MTNPDELAPAPSRRRRLARVAAGLAGAVVLLPSSLGVVLGLFHKGPEPGLEPWAGALPARSDEQVVVEGDADGDGLDDVLELAVAKRHAPLYRFTGRDPAGPDCPQNQDEHYLPMSVSRFLACLEGGVYQVRGEGAVKADAPGRFGEGRVTHFPSRLEGEPIGEAPVYSHVTPGPTQGQVFVEYWLWHGYDRGDARFLGIPVPFADHRGDWEHTAFLVSLDPPRVLKGWYYGHALALIVPREDLELAAPEHPTVYVAQGKHASYPRACIVPSTDFAPTVHHHDIANGLGPSWESWKGPVIDLGEKDRPRPETPWLTFMGRWGDDGLEAIKLGISPTGPAAKSNWGNNGPGVPWRELIARRGGEVLLPR